MKRQKQVKVWVTGLLILAMVWLVACGGGGSGSTASTEEAKALLEDRCTQCHGLEKVEGVQKTREQWDQTVTRMVEKGANLNAEEQTTLVDYLAEAYGP